MTRCSFKSEKRKQAALFAAMREELGVAVLPGHVFSAEIEPRKREYLKHTLPELEHLYSDMTDLASGNVKNNVTNGFEKPPCAGRFTAGFPCTSASLLNPHAGTLQNMSCCADGTGATGEVWGGTGL